MKRRGGGEASIQQAAEQILGMKGVPYIHVEYRAHKSGEVINSSLEGLPDIVFPASGLEIKDIKGRLSKAQVRLHTAWAGCGIPVVTTYGMDDTLAYIQRMIGGFEIHVGCGRRKR